MRRQFWQRKDFFDSVQEIGPSTKQYSSHNPREESQRFSLYRASSHLYPSLALMTSSVLHTQAKNFDKKRPELRPGYTVRVHERIREGEKERTQIFEGLIIGIHRGHTATDASFTVRRIASGIGVEKIFSFDSPMVEKIEVKKIAKVRRAKLNFLRGRRGKSARLSERFTNADEFAVAVQAPVASAMVEEIPVEEKSIPTDAVESKAS